MKKPNLKRYGKWKDWKRLGFHFYFVLLTTVVVMITITLAGGLSVWIEKASKIDFPTILLMLGFGLIIGGILSFAIGMTLLKPISKLHSAMNEVAEGNLDISVEEKSIFDEIENINHSFNIMMKELRSNQMIQKDFVSNVAHEFKTPLNTINGYATLLQDESLTSAEREEYTKEIISTISDMSELVGNILLISKTSNQGITYNKIQFSLDEQIRKVLVLLEPKWSEKNIEIDVDLNKIEITSNESLLSNVWRNLVENAIKFSPNNSKITISLKEQNKKIVFKVCDQGQGIKEQDKKHIFEKFYQADTSHKQEGNGLGLPLVKNIIDLLDGKVEVDNLQPNGCCFTVTIPADI